MIEHHVPLVAQVCDYVYCLNFGEMLAEGTPDQVRSHPEVIRAYLGQEADEVLGASECPEVKDEPARGRRACGSATASPSSWGSASSSRKARRR